MKGVWTSLQIREAEQVLLDRSPEGALMRRAAFGLEVVVRRMLAERAGGVSGRRVALLVGAGNNGGDALWAGAGLRRRGAGVTAVLLAPDKAHPAGLAALCRAGGRVLAAGDDGARSAVTEADVLVDGIVGIAGRGPLRPAAASLVAAADEAGVPVVAVDLPSGVDPDTGAVDGPAVAAARTVTFGALKPVHVLAAPRCGPVQLVDIGLGPLLPAPHAQVLDAADVAAGWPVPGPADDKYTQGVAGVAAGSATYPGAAVLTTGAAVLATSGMVRYAGPAADEVRARWPEVVASDTLDAAGQTRSWAVGPGIGLDEAARGTLAAVIDRGVPLCIDADAITLLSRHEDLRHAVRGRSVVLTPHDREFARLCGDVGTDRIGAARRAAADLDVTVLLKGNATVVAAPDGRVLVHPSPESWAATAGSGDVLSGIVGALLAAGREPCWAGGAATFLHGRAAVLAARGAPAPASMLQVAIPAAIRALRAPARRRAG
ncbi:bifunctional ADP-dependent NAD(P)H-hydrate dehydratase/NAD(P)H-hydrate epimerase [Pseudonocardia asaccharolytica]|uniref:Bifunctional NAD(P)H-hydrate repair enzyme n=1 Tax=Pseudonocardia asaccharolytica DSM 44247 = NBRC 16224 TaxID=1123024 RepID=A0A511D048_9PSEU|nr:bifunctional ADP-dependent NAD(P)H-hydrate dehydratase/NAD(P)H-hydrate epimerase [Pseudonocardia asaccharolytica]GEL16238.1 bifunctional NAD(P)H-hydrate repair enzyme [Pseudonocardia asaccharolytica DSM 44247 = NBRC 16224]